MEISLHDILHILTIFAAETNPASGIPGLNIKDFEGIG